MIYKVVTFLTLSLIANSAFSITVLPNEYAKNDSEKYDEKVNKQNNNNNSFNLDINGEGHFLGYYTKNKWINNESESGVSNSTKFAVNALNKLNDDISYGVNSEIKLSSNSIKPKHMYVFLDSKYGRFEAGNYKTAADILKLDASSIATIDGGIDNSWVSLSGVNKDSFHTLPYLYTSYAREKTGDIYPKTITFYSPEFSLPVKFGVSFTHKNKNEDCQICNNIKAYKNVFSAGATYENDFDNIKFKLSATSEIGSKENENAQHNNLFGMNVGMGVQYAGLKLAASFANLAKSGLNNDTKLKDTIYLTFGGSYEVGPAMTSLGYFTSKASVNNSENKLNLLSLGAHYHLGGKIFKFTPYVALNCFKTDNVTSGKKSNYVFLTGLKVVY
jgi:hypothetical protein